MDDMQFSKYSWEISKVLENINEEGMEKLVRNAVYYAFCENTTKTNCLARELFVDALPEEIISDIFDE